MEQTAYELLKETCTTACHERQACVSGYKQMLASENVSQMMATWRNNWEDVVNSKYADIIRTELPKQYPALKEEMNQAGIYMNECPEDAKRFVKVIVTDTETPVRIYGEAQAYVLGAAKVIAFGHSQVYNNTQTEAHVMLYDYAFGKIMAGRTFAYNRSTLQCCCEVLVDGAVECDAFGGSVRAVSCRRINAYCDTIIYSRTDKGISLNGTAHIEPLTNTDNEQ